MTKLGWTEYLLDPTFWEETLQNSTIYPRQRGSPKSKPVGAPHGETGSSG